MKLNIKKGTAAALVGAALFLTVGAASCDTGNPEFAQREQAQASKKAKTTSLEIVNLKRKMALEEDPSRVGYVYLFTMEREPIGYYVIKGKVSSSGSQLTPENDVIRDAGQYGGGNVVTDGPQDDGTFGEGDPGVFFFLANGVMVETKLTPLYSTAPLPTFLNAPLLGGK